MKNCAHFTSYVSFFEMLAKHMPQVGFLQVMHNATSCSVTFATFSREI